MFHNLYFVWGWVPITVDGWTSTLLTMEANACNVLVKGICETWEVIKSGKSVVFVTNGWAGIIGVITSY